MLKKSKCTATVQADWKSEVFMLIFPFSSCWNSPNMYDWIHEKCAKFHHYQQKS